MSRTWDLEVGADARAPSARVRLAEFHLYLMLTIEYPNLAEVACYLDEESARDIRDWLSWYLDEGPEPAGDVVEAPDVP